ncbi:Predicted O-linked N-acetylglucosamine transferase, SPINDLY family [Selenomonas sp. GACV-9]|uniref:O-linked N-acetylglucosamine transferase, SPINDLY family protein n=1 Tax=Selenomonas sp. GACV-9 TaxID=3158782 RepID=UPI0008E3174C|nr:Predicted O-linked N-acetylglucosamine transferase, SPINDLY family [Selenomonas ruminantium]
MNHDVLNWLSLADKFAADGDPKGMRACARELWELDAESMDGAAVMAEAALYSGEREEAHTLVDEILARKPNHLRGRLVKAGLAALEFRLDEELPLLRAIVAETERKRQALDPDDAYYGVLQHILDKARGWLADGEYLAAAPDKAAAELLARSELLEDPLAKADSYSKYLFMRNYRNQSLHESRQAAEQYEPLLGITAYAHDDVKKLPDKKLRIGYLSPDFREHAVASFLEPLLRYYDDSRFSVYCYSTGRADNVTKKLRTCHVHWRELRGRSPRTAARLIAEEKIDILVDLSGHTQGSCLPIMAYRPAPVQVAGIGYMNTTGLSAIDYFLSDEVCLPTGETTASGFTEKILRLPHSHLCYAPGFVREIPAAGMEAPCLRNGYVTFGSFNNFAKVTDETLLLWRGILDQVRDSRLVIKGKICSIPSGQAIVKERLMRLGISLARVELRPYSPDYLEQYRDIDIALDTMPYNGGLTTCEALYMGVPVVSIRGRSHGARFGASILTNAGVKELVVENDINYVRRAVQLGNAPELIGAYHSGLRANLLKSPLMDRKNYMKELETGYCQIWKNFCTN